MNSFRNLILIFLGALFVSSCVATSTSTSSASLSYSEDLSAYHPVVSDSFINVKPSEIPSFRKTSENYRAKEDVTNILNAKLDTLAESNKEIRSVGGLSIQIYSGSSSEVAYQARDTAMTILPEIRTVVQYNQPIYKVRVGKYTEKLEAQRTLMKLKPKFPNAIAVPTTIYIN